MGRGDVGQGRAAAVLGGGPGLLFVFFYRAFFFIVRFFIVVVQLLCWEVAPGCSLVSCCPQLLLRSLHVPSASAFLSPSAGPHIACPSTPAPPPRHRWARMVRTRARWRARLRPQGLPHWSKVRAGPPMPGASTGVGCARSTSQPQAAPPSTPQH